METNFNQQSNKNPQEYQQSQQAQQSYYDPKKSPQISQEYQQVIPSQNGVNPNRVNFNGNGIDDPTIGVNTNAQSPNSNIGISQKYTTSDSDQVEESTRGVIIPEISKEISVPIADTNMILDKFKNMSSEEREKITIDAIHYSNGKLEAVRLTNGDVITAEAAIALAKNWMISGYTTGKTIYHQRVLRSRPGPKYKDVRGIHQLPRF